jgi:hypothetical protein
MISFEEALWIFLLFVCVFSTLVLISWDLHEKFKKNNQGKAYRIVLSNGRFTKKEW